MPMIFLDCTRHPHRLHWKCITIHKLFITGQQNITSFPKDKSSLLYIQKGILLMLCHTALFDKPDIFHRIVFFVVCP